MLRCPQEATWIPQHSRSRSRRSLRKKDWQTDLSQSIKGVTAKQAAWRPGRGRHNIWESDAHAVGKYASASQIEGESAARSS